jgi:pyruvate formate lyase activating enzyme
MKIFGLQKLTLLDYPGKTAATIFISGCEYNCPYCQNAAYMDEESDMATQASEAIEFLKTRKKLLEGVCISGGEPLAQEEIEDFIAQIKELGYPVKLDTNGQFPKRLKKLAEQGLVDYIAMDIKSSRQNYGAAIGIESFDTTQVEESAKFLLSGSIPYEFRTTVVRELHKAEDFHLIGQWLEGAEKFYLQNFKDCDGVPAKDLSAYSDEEMQKFIEILSIYDIVACFRP